MLKYCIGHYCAVSDIDSWCHKFLNGWITHDEPDKQFTSRVIALALQSCHVLAMQACCCVCDCKARVMDMWSFVWYILSLNFTFKSSFLGKVICIAFTCTLNAWPLQWYGTTVHEFRGVPQAMYTMLGSLRGLTPFFIDMMSLSPSLAFVTLYTSTFFWVMYLAVFGLVLAALSDSYALVQQQMFYHNTMEMQDYEMINFTLRRFKRWLGITKPKPVSTDIQLNDHVHIFS